jgi:hypothetical protein
VRPHQVELRIEELVLDGFAPGDEAAVGDGVEQELARRLAPGLVGDAATAAVGAQVARAVRQAADR